MIYELLLMLYVVGTVWGLWLVFKKAGVAPWKALVPVWNIVEWLRICHKKWSWYVAFLIPGINIFMFLLLVQETAKCFRRTNFWEQLAAILVPFVYLPLIGLSSWQFHDPKTEPSEKVSEIRDWTEAIVFALIAAVLIRGFVFELFSIPSSSMEKSLLVGDHLVVDKMAYGPRVIMTPLSLPLVHNTLGGSSKSYLEWPQLPYHRFPGYSHVKRFDAVVFNFPAGDTILSNFPGCQITYYQVAQQCGRDSVLRGNALYTYPNSGGITVAVGKVMTRPLDKREHYIKRCIGLPGEELKIVDGVVHIDGRPIELPQDAEYNYRVTFARGSDIYRLLDECGVSKEDIETAPGGLDAFDNVCIELPLSHPIESLLKQKASVMNIERVIHPVDSTLRLFPNAEGYYWSEDSFGPIHIPAEGEEVELSLQNLPLYHRVITAYEHNRLEVRNGQIFINDQPTSRYKFKQNYYWMMGDNRHNSQDSRFWGFVPEDHIVGRALWVLWNWDKDHSRVRWNRTMKNANAR